MKDLIISSICLVLCLINANFALSQTKVDAGSHLIPVSVTFRSKELKYAVGLRAEDFEIYQGKDRLEIMEILPIDEAAAIGILIDRSGSVDLEKKRYEHSMTGLVDFLSGLSENNKFILGGFQSEDIVITDVITDKTKLRSGLEFVSTVKPQGLTPLYDAVKLSIDKMASTGLEKKILILLTDGIDTGSELLLSQLRQSIVRSDVIIYSINIEKQEKIPSMMMGRESRGLEFLSDMAEASGGKVLSLPYRVSSDDINFVLTNEVKYLYFIRVKVDRTDKDPKKRSVKVKLSKETNKRLGKVTLTSKQNYFF